MPRSSVRMLGLLLALLLPLPPLLTASSTASPTTALGCTLARCIDCLQAGYTTSGVYALTHGVSGGSWNTYCDMSTDGGGWMLVLSYNKAANSNPSLTESLPTSPTTDNRHGYLSNSFGTAYPSMAAANINEVCLNATTVNAMTVSSSWTSSGPLAHGGSFAEGVVERRFRIPSTPGDAQRVHSVWRGSWSHTRTGTDAGPIVL